MTRTLIVLALLVPILYGCGTFIGLFGKTAEEAAELAGEGGDRVLLDPMRPLDSGPRVLVIALDGVGGPLLEAALAAGDLPNLAGLLGPSEGDGVYAQAFAVQRVASVFPAETAAGWAAVFTGTPPSESGIVGNEWFDRDSLAMYAPVPLSVSSYRQTLRIYTDDLLGNLIATPTLYERADVRAHVSMAFVYRGADLISLPDLNDIGDMLEIGASLITGDKGEPFRELDEDTFEGVNSSTRKYGVPRLQVAYFSGADLTFHGDGDESGRGYLRDEVDQRIGDILELYEARDALRDLHVVVVSDHGHTASLDTDRNSLEAEHDHDEPFALLDSLGLRVRDPKLGDEAGPFDVVVAFNEASAALYLADRSTCPRDEREGTCDWSVGPRLEDDVLPVARAIARASQADSGSVGGLSGAVDLIFARSSRSADSDTVPFQVLDGDRLVPLADYFRRHPRPDLFDLEKRLAWLTDGPFGYRAGDIVVLAKVGEEIPIEERFYFGPPRVSGHGGAGYSDGEIALIVASPSMTGTALRESVRRAVGDEPTQLDVTQLVLALLGVDETR